MATQNMLTTKILLLNGTQVDWEKLPDYVLSKGEPAVEFVPTVGSESTTLSSVKIKIGDGFTKWSDLPYIGDEFNAKFDEIDAAIEASGNAVFQIDAADLASVDGATEADKIAAYITDDVHEGNIAIVKKAITSSTYSYTAYVYCNDVWAAMDGNYNAENVYFNEDLTYTADIGALTLNGKNSDTLEAQGKSLEAVLKSILAKTIAPEITQPSFSLTIKSVTTDTGTKEIGSKITAVQYDGTFSGGKYSFGSVDADGNAYTANDGTGVTATYLVTNELDNQTATTIDGTFNLTTPVQINSTSNTSYGSIVATATWGNSARTPVNNIGEEVDGAIESGSADEDASIKVTGYRSSFYYIGNDCTSAINSAFIRSTTSKNANTKSFGTVTIPAGTNRVMFAVPGSATLNSVIDVDGMGLDVKGNFTTNTVSVEGANNFTATNYTVFVCDTTEGLSATKYTVSIS